VRATSPSEHEEYWRTLSSEAAGGSGASRRAAASAKESDFASTPESDSERRRMSSSAKRSSHASTASATAATSDILPIVRRLRDSIAQNTRAPQLVFLHHLPTRTVLYGCTTARRVSASKPPLHVSPLDAPGGGVSGHASGCTKTRQGGCAGLCALRSRPLGGVARRAGQLCSGARSVGGARALAAPGAPCETPALSMSAEANDSQAVLLGLLTLSALVVEQLGLVRAESSLSCVPARSRRLDRRRHLSPPSRLAPARPRACLWAPLRCHGALQRCWRATAARGRTLRTLHKVPFHSQQPPQPPRLPRSQPRPARAHWQLWRARRAPAACAGPPEAFCWPRARCARSTWPSCAPCPAPSRQARRCWPRMRWASRARPPAPTAQAQRGKRSPHQTPLLSLSLLPRSQPPRSPLRSCGHADARQPR